MNPEESKYVTEIIHPEDEAAFARVAKALGDGEVVGMPTETVYGLGANALNPHAVARIFVAKGRPLDNPLIVHVASKESILPLVAEITPIAKVLMDAFMPGPITLVMKKSALIPDVVSCGLDTVGIRFPIHPVARKLIEQSGVPVAAPSANLSGSPSPTKASHVYHDMHEKIPYIVDGGDCNVGLESTVVDVTKSWPQILRPGYVTMPMIENALQEKGFTKPVDYQDTKEDKGSAPRAPGMKYRHYAPHALVTIVNDADEADAFLRYNEALRTVFSENNDAVVGMFCGEEVKQNLEKDLPEDMKAKTIFYCYGDGRDNRAASHALFDGLRSLDEAHVTHILAAGFAKKGLGLAYMNRLQKAAGDTGKEEKVPALSIKRVLFLCTGNTCRSPLAVASFSAMARKNEPFSEKNNPQMPVRLDVSSAGISAAFGDPAASHSIQIAKDRYGIDLSMHRSRTVNDYIMEQSDLVLSVSDGHSDILRRQYPEYKAKIFSFAQYLAKNGISDVNGNIPDPYGKGLSEYMRTADALDEIFAKIYPFILEDLQIFGYIM